MSSRLLAYSRIGHTAILKFNSPKSLNALTEEIGNEFSENLDELSKDLSIRCLILTGEGKAFSAGGDLDFLRQRSTSTPEDNVATMREFYRKFLSIRNVPFPTIAAINGHAIGAGLCLALACDLRIASASAKVGLNFTRLGLSPGMCGTHLLPLLIGQQNASRMMLAGDIVAAQKARELGLFVDVVEGGVLMQESLKLAERISSASPVAVRATVKTIRMRVDDGIERALQREADSQAHCFAAPDYIEGLNAIVEKRDPLFI